MKVTILAVLLLLAVLAIVLLLAVLPTQAHRKQGDGFGNGLYEHLMTCSDVPNASPDNDYGELPCISAQGYINGVISALEATKAIHLRDGVKFTQEVDVIRTYLEKHPERRDLDTVKLIIEALAPLSSAHSAAPEAQ